jgi:hypothetical protein
MLSEGITPFQCAQDQVFSLLRVDLSGEGQWLGLSVQEDSAFPPVYKVDVVILLVLFLQCVALCDNLFDEEHLELLDHVARHRP